MIFTCSLNSGGTSEVIFDVFLIQGFVFVCHFFIVAYICSDKIYFLYLFSVVVYASHSALQIKDKNCLRLPIHWDRRFESYSRHECLCLFRVCVVLCVDSGLVRA
jgi:hypothetical protein